MPVRDKFGNVVEGAWGGVVNATERNQTMRGKEADITGANLQNLKSVYEFQEYLDNRRYRDLKKESEATNAEININTAPSREDATRMQNKVNTRKGESYMKSADDIDRNMNQKLDFAWEQSSRDMMQADKDFFISSSAFIDEHGGNLTEDSYSDVYNNLVTGLAGRDRDPKNIVKLLENQFGVTADYTPANIERIQRIGSMALHDKELAQKEHLAKLEAKYEAMYDTKGVKFNKDIGKWMQDSETARSQMDLAAARGDKIAYHKAKLVMEESQAAITRYIKSDQHGLLKTEQAQQVESIKRIMGLSGDTEPDSQILGKYNKIMKAIGTMNPSLGPKELETRFDELYEYKMGNAPLSSPSQWNWGSGHLQPRSYEGYRQKQLEDRALIKSMSDMTAISNAINAQSPAQQTKIREQLTDYLTNLKLDKQ